MTTRHQQNPNKKAINISKMKNQFLDMPVHVKHQPTLNNDNHRQSNHPKPQIDQKETE